MQGQTYDSSGGGAAHDVDWLLLKPGSHHSTGGLKFIFT